MESIQWKESLQRIGTLYEHMLLLSSVQSLMSTSVWISADAILSEEAWVGLIPNIRYNRTRRSRKDDINSSNH